MAHRGFSSGCLLVIVHGNRKERISSRGRRKHLFGFDWVRIGSEVSIWVEQGARILTLAIFGFILWPIASASSRIEAQLRSPKSENRKKAEGRSPKGLPRPGVVFWFGELGSIIVDASILGWAFHGRERRELEVAGGRMVTRDETVSRSFQICPGREEKLEVEAEAEIGLAPFSPWDDCALARRRRVIRVGHAVVCPGP